MTMTTTFTQPSVVGMRMYETLLGKNQECLVTVHRGQITKITPVKRADVCVGVARRQGVVDNTAMLNALMAAPFGEYAVKVCYGRIVEVAPVAKDEAVKVQDLEPLGVVEEGVVVEEMQPVRRRGSKSPG